MEYTAVFEEPVTLTPKDLRSPIKNLNAILEEKLRKRLEGKCYRHGYVVPDSVHLLSRSLGTVDRGRFTGNFLFHVQLEGKVLNPPDRTILEGEVIRKNKMGIYVNYRNAIHVIIPRDANVGKEDFDNVEIGETVSVEIKKSRFQVNDEYILSVGLFIARKEGAIKPAVKSKIVSEDQEETDQEETDQEETDQEETDQEETDQEETNPPSAAKIPPSNTK
jgi:DNA-directed RNA polymerase subunit E'/Rpb7